MLARPPPKRLDQSVRIVGINSAYQACTDGAGHRMDPVQSLQLEARGIEMRFYGKVPTDTETRAAALTHGS